MSSFKVLIVDDSDDVRDRLTSMLSGLPEISVISRARNSREAISSLSEMKHDVVILDIQMPVDNGIGLIQVTKKNSQAPVIIILTNYDYPQYRERCIKEGADFFFDKSDEFEMVREVLKSLAAKKS